MGPAGVPGPVVVAVRLAGAVSAERLTTRAEVLNPVLESKGSVQMGRQVYELRVRGPVPAELLEEIGAEDFGEEPPLTILRTEPTDQPGLHGMLQRLRSLGLDLMEVRTAGPDPMEVRTAVPEPREVRTAVPEPREVRTPVRDPSDGGTT